MSVGVAATPIPDQSFEELRVHDYLHAYRSTGQPPLPCPQSPDTPNARTALGLAPLFVPTAIPVPSDSLGNTNTSDAPATLLANLPPVHEHHPAKTILGEYFETISAQTLYSHFSHEELRYHAYISGHKMPPLTANTMDSSLSSSSGRPSYASDSQTTAYAPSVSVSGPPDHLMSITASSRFDSHSFEELRIAYLSAGKEVGSSEIPSRGALPAQSAPTLIGRPRGDAFSSGSLKLF